MKLRFSILLFFLVSALYTQGQEVKLGLPVGHTGDVNSAEFSPNGKYVVTSSEDGTAKLFEVTTGTLIHSFNDHTAFVLSAKFSRNGAFIVTASRDSTIKIFNVFSGALIRSIQTKSSYPLSAEFSPNGNRIIAQCVSDPSYKISRRTCKIFDATTGNLIHSLEEASYGVFNPNGNLFAVAFPDNAARIYETNSRKLIHTLKGHSKTISSVQFSPDGRYVITASYDSTSKIFDVSNGNLIHTISDNTDKLNRSRISPNNKHAITLAFDGTAKIFNISTGSLIHTLNTNIYFSSSPKFSSDGKFVILTENSPLDSPKVLLYNVSTGELQYSLEGHTWYILSANFSSDGNYLVTSSSDNTAHIYNLNTGKLIHILKGRTDFIRSVQFSSDDEHIVYCSNRSAKIFDSSSGMLVHVFKENNERAFLAEFSPNGKLVAIAFGESLVNIFDVSTGDIISKLKTPFEDKSIRRMHFSPDGDYLIVNDLMGDQAAMFEVRTGELLSFQIGRGYETPQFSPDNKHYMIQGDIYSLSTDEMIHSFKGSDGMFSPDGKNVALISFDYDNRTSEVLLYDLIYGTLIFSIDLLEDRVKSIKFSPDGIFISVLTNAITDNTKFYNVKTGKLDHSITVDNSYGVKFTSNDNYIISNSSNAYYQIYNIPTGELLFTYTGQYNSVNSAQVSYNGNYAISAPNDGSLLLFDLPNNRVTLRRFIFDSDPNKWVHLHPSGLFDASPEAMEMMYWTKGLEVIQFDQLKDRYWLPGLWKKVMSGEYLPNVRSMDKLKLQPKLEVGEIVDNEIPIHLTKRDGGYGKVSIFINGKEVAQDARGEGMDTTLTEQTINYSIKDHPYLVNGDNKIEVQASSADGFVEGRRAGFNFSFIQEEISKPQFFGVVIGVSDYANELINLDFPVKDAQAIKTSIELGANNLFGPDKTHIYALTSKSDLLPTKANMESVFKEISIKANAEDVIFIYLSGHGITYGGDQGDFHFLTSDAMSASKDAYYDSAIRQNNTVSTADLVKWLKTISALKQVMVLDACGSGKAVDNLIASRDVDASQIKAIDRMKDRTGMFIVSGCAADKVSFEASQYGQGLLTYAILDAMKGKAVKGKNVDVFTIMNYARETVPNLAKGIGGIQTPQLLIPRGGSFDIGILNEEDKSAIPIEIKNVL